MKAAAERQQIETTVEDAISKGKSTASRRKHWVALIAADPGMADLLAAVPNEAAVPMTEIGHGVGSESGDLAEPVEWSR